MESLTADRTICSWGRFIAGALNVCLKARDSPANR